MDTLSPARLDALRAEWTDQFVRVNPHSPELQRFGETVGRVVTVNWNGKALIDFQDGGWYDITASADCLTPVDAETAKKYDAKANSARPRPDRQG